MLLTTDMIVRESINGAWFLLCLYMVGIFGIYLVPEIVRGNCWLRKDRNKAALGLCFYFIGGAMFHGWIWYLLREARLHGLNGFLANSYGVIVASAVFALIGSIFCIMTFAERRWSHVAWLGAATVVSVYLAWEFFW